MAQVSCNVRVPFNAIATSDLERGMKFYRLQEPEVIHTARTVLNFGISTDEGEIVEVSARHGHIGVVYLYEPAEAYDYHAGHGCKAELKS